MENSGRRIAALIALPAVLLFGWLAYTVAYAPAESFDLTLRDTLHAWASPQLTFAMRGFTILGSETFLVPLGLLLVWRFIADGRRTAAAFLVVASLGGEAWDQGLKLFFRRARPEAFFGISQPDTYSFPSGHSMASFCFYGALALIAIAQTRSPLRRWAIGLGVVALALMVGFSRIYLGVHYPTDVLGGYLAGIAWLALICGTGHRIFWPVDRR
jgi:undecaprenyl-diphosphatase